MIVDASAMDAFIRTLPKAELDVHLEGAMEPDVMMRLSNKHGGILPYNDADELRDAFQRSPLRGNTAVIDEANAVLNEADDFRQLAAGYLAQARAQGIVHSEILFEPQRHMERGLPLATVVTGLGAAVDDARANGIEVRLIACLLRDRGETDALDTLEAAAAFPERIDAIALSAPDGQHSPAMFQRVFDRARDLGWPTMAHPGDAGSPRCIREALDTLATERIEQGIQCATDEALCRRLADDGVTLTVSPIANVRAGAFQDLAEHNLKELLDYGIQVTINSHAPCHCGAYLPDNLFSAWRSLPMGPETLKEIVRNSFRGAMLPASRRNYWLEQVDGVPTPRAA